MVGWRANMGKVAISLVFFITLASVILVTVVQTLPPCPLPENAPADEFSAERAGRHIRAIASRPRLTGSLEYRLAASYVLVKLKDMGLEAETQRRGVVQNTIGWIKGKNSSDIILLTAHLDSKGGPGATDDASGVAVLLETARALMSSTPLRNTVMFLFTDNEEGGYKGAKFFIDHHPRARNVRIVVGFDAGGLSGPDVLSATSANNGWIIRQLAKADTPVSGSSAINSLATTKADFTGAFQVAGYSGYAFSLYWDRRIHTPEDDIKNLNPSSIQHQGYHALSLARHFGRLDRLSDSKAPDAVYFSVLGLFTVYYSPVWAIVMAIAATGLFIFVLVYGLKRNILSWKGIVYGACVLLIGLIIAPLPDILLGKWISNFTSRLIDRSLNQPFQVGIMVLIMLSLTMLWYYLSRRIKNTSLYDLAMGALVPLLIGMAITSVVFPELSYAFTWPLLFSLLAIANWFYSHVHRKSGKTIIPGLLISGAAGIVIVGPTILLGLFDQISLSLVILSLLCGFLAPQIHLMLGGEMENR